jgi:chromosome segregation ATPase
MDSTFDNEILAASNERLAEMLREERRINPRCTHGLHTMAAADRTDPDGRCLWCADIRETQAQLANAITYQRELEGRIEGLEVQVDHYRAGMATRKREREEMHRRAQAAESELAGLQDLINREPDRYSEYRLARAQAGNQRLADELAELRATVASLTEERNEADLACARIREERDEARATLARVQSAAKTIVAGADRRVLTATAHEPAAREAIATLDSEREANAILTAELDRLEKDRACWALRANALETYSERLRELVREGIRSLADDHGPMRGEGCAACEWLTKAAKEVE